MWEDKQTLFKNGDQYYHFHKDKLLKLGYKIVEETSEHLVFVLEKKNEKVSA